MRDACVQLNGEARNTESLRMVDINCGLRKTQYCDKAEVFNMQTMSVNPYSCSKKYFMVGITLDGTTCTKKRKRIR